MYSNEGRCAAKNAVLTKRFLDTYKQLSYIVSRQVKSIEAQLRRQERRAEFAGGSNSGSRRGSLVTQKDDVKMVNK